MCPTVADAAQMLEDIQSLIPACKEGRLLSGYLYLRYINVVDGVYTDHDQLRHDLYEVCPNLFADRSKLYDNGGSEVYR